MISIECHRVGELCSGKPEFDNRIESGQGKSCAYIPFKIAENRVLSTEHNADLSSVYTSGLVRSKGVYDIVCHVQTGEL